MKGEWHTREADRLSYELLETKSRQNGWSHWVVDECSLHDAEYNGAITKLSHLLMHEAYPTVNAAWVPYNKASVLMCRFNTENAVVFVVETVVINLDTRARTTETLLSRWRFLLNGFTLYRI